MMEQGRSRFAARHSLLAAGGVIHVRASQSISAHVALRTSFVRQAVRIVCFTMWMTCLECWPREEKGRGAAASRC